MSVVRCVSPAEAGDNGLANIENQTRKSLCDLETHVVTTNVISSTQDDTDKWGLTPTPTSASTLSSTTPLTAPHLSSSHNSKHTSKLPPSDSLTDIRIIPSKLPHSDSSPSRSRMLRRRASGDEGEMQGEQSSSDEEDEVADDEVAAKVSDEESDSEAGRLAKRQLTMQMDLRQASSEEMSDEEDGDDEVEVAARVSDEESESEAGMLAKRQLTMQMDLAARFSRQESLLAALEQVSATTIEVLQRAQAQQQQQQQQTPTSPPREHQTPTSPPRELETPTSPPRELETPRSDPRIDAVREELQVVKDSVNKRILSLERQHWMYFPEGSSLWHLVWRIPSYITKRVVLFPADLVAGIVRGIQNPVDPKTKETRRRHVRLSQQHANIFSTYATGMSGTPTRAPSPHYQHQYTPSNSHRLFGLAATATPMHAPSAQFNATNPFLSPSSRTPDEVLISPPTSNPFRTRTPSAFSDAVRTPSAFSESVTSNSTSPPFRRHSSFPHVFQPTRSPSPPAAFANIYQSPSSPPSARFLRCSQSVGHQSVARQSVGHQSVAHQSVARSPRP